MIMQQVLLLAETGGLLGLSGFHHSQETETERTLLNVPFGTIPRDESVTE